MPVPNLAGVGSKGSRRDWLSVVGSGRGAVSVLRPVRFLGPPSEPDVPVSEHPALHVFMPAGYATFCSLLVHGVGML